MLLSGARIYVFPTRQKPEHLLTLRDKLELHAWDERIIAAGFRCMQGQDTQGIHHDFVQLYRQPDAAPAWTLVRTGALVRAWRGTCGPDLGRYPTLGEALSAVLAADAMPTPLPDPSRTRLTGRRRPSL